MVEILVKRQIGNRIQSAKQIADNRIKSQAQDIAAQRTREASQSERLEGQIGVVDQQLGEVRNAPVIALALTDILEADRALVPSADIDFLDDGPKGNISLFLVATGVVAGIVGGPLAIPVIEFDNKGRAISVSEELLGTAAALDSDNDPLLSANSALRLATQAAVKAYIDSRVTGALKFVGAIDCSTTPNYPAASKGDSYIVSVAGKIGGASGKAVDAGDLAVCSANNGGGNEATVGASWFVLEHNLQGALLAANNFSDVPSPATARANIGAGTVSSVAASGGTTGLSFSGGPITGSGTLTLAGTLGVGSGGSGTATAFTAGSILFAGASGIYSQDNGNLFWDNAGKRLGIGVTPTFRLDVAGANDLQRLTSSTATVGTLYTDSAGTVRVGTRNGRFIVDVGIERIGVDTSGNFQMGGTNTVIDANRLLYARSYTVATLPTPGTGGRLAFASNCRVFNGAGAQEGAGAGTGGLVSDNGSAWKIAGTNVTAVA